MAQATRSHSGTERKRRAADRELLVELYEQLGRLSDEAEIVRVAGSMLAARLGLDCYHYVDIDEERAEVTIRHFWHAQDVPAMLGTYPLASFLPPDGLALARAGVTNVVRDVQSRFAGDDPGRAALRAGAVATRIAAWVAVPYSQDGSWKAYFAAADSKPREWIQSEIELIQEVANTVSPRIERVRSDAALRASEVRLAHDLEATEILQSIGNQLMSTPGVDGQFDQLSEAARVLMRSDCASVQVYDQASARLRLVGNVGFHPDSTAFWEWVDAGSATACGRALATGGRVIVPDTELFEADVPEHEAWRSSGIASVQATPLVASTGEVVGMMSTHWHRPDAPTDANYRFFDILARVAADFILRTRAEARLRESEEKYRTLFASVDQGFCVYELVTDAAGKVIDLRYLDTNPAFEKHMGFRPLPGQTAREFVPDLEDSWFEFNAGVARTGRTQRFENFASELQKWYEVSVVPFPTDKDKLAGIFVDITDRKLREQQQDYLIKLSDALRPLEDPAQIKFEASRVLRQELGVNRALYAEIVDDNWSAERGYARDVDLLQTGVHSSDTYGPWIMQTYRRGEALVLDDVRTDSRFTKQQRAASESASIIGTVGVPLVKGGELVAVLSVHTAQPRRWTAHDIAFVEETAERTWAAVERAKAEGALRASEDKFSALFAASPTPFLIVRPDPPRFTVFEVNDAYLADTMRTREDLVGTGLFEAFPDNPDDPAADGVRNLRASLDRALESGRPDAMPVQKYDIARPDGSFEERWWRPVNAPVLTQNGQVQAIIHHVSDVTEEHRAEIARRATNERRAFLLTMSDALTPLRAASDVKATASRLLGEHLGVGRAFFAEIVGDDWIVGDAYDDGSSPLEPGRYPAAEYGRWTMDTLRAGDVVAVADTATDERLEPSERDALQRIGNAAVVGVPLVRYGEVVAVLSLHSHEPREWTDAELEIVQEIAERTWPAVERARVEESLSESEERQAFLLSLTDALRPLDDVLMIKATATRVLAEHLAATRAEYFDVDATEEHLETIDGYADGELGRVGRVPIAGLGRAVASSLRAGRTVAVADFRDDPNVAPAERPAYETRDFRAFVAVPVMKRRHLVAMLAVVDAAVRAWTPDEIALIEETAERTWGAVERAREEARRIVAEERLSTIEDYAIFGLDPDGRITDWTEGAERVFGYTAEEAVGQPVASLHPPERANQALDEIRVAARDGRFERDGWRVRKDGSRIWANTVVTAVRDIDGSLRGFTKVSRDLTDRKRLEDERGEALAREQEARQEAERALQVRDEFLAIVSHELRTPLSAILLWTRILGRSRAAGQDFEAVETIERNAEAQRVLIEDLLDASRFMSGNVKLEKRSIDLGSLVAEVADAMRPQASERRVRLVVRRGAAVRAAVDAERFRQALRAVVDNAIRYSGPMATVTVSVRPVNGVPEVTVSDTGRGIDPDVLPHIFERFRRGVDDNGGLGLGLAIAHDIVTFHGGTLTAENRGPRRGSRFVIRLPAATAARRTRRSRCR